MKEYMLLVRNRKDHNTSMPPEKHEEFVRKCMVYIDGLKLKGQLIAAQPLVREGTVISNPEGEWDEKPFQEHGEVQVGYYHIRAKDLDEAIEIAKGNPEFEYTKTAKVEVRPIKTKEEVTNFEYPK